MQHHNRIPHLGWLKSNYFTYSTVPVSFLDTTIPKGMSVNVTAKREEVSFTVSSADVLSMSNASDGTSYLGISFG